MERIAPCSEIWRQLRWPSTSRTPPSRKAERYCWRSQGTPMIRLWSQRRKSKWIFLERPSQATGSHPSHLHRSRVRALSSTILQANSLCSRQLTRAMEHGICMGSVQGRVRTHLSPNLLPWSRWVTTLRAASRKISSKASWKRGPSPGKFPRALWTFTGHKCCNPSMTHSPKLKTWSLLAHPVRLCFSQMKVTNLWTSPSWRTPQPQTVSSLACPRTENLRISQGVGSELTKHWMRRLSVATCPEVPLKVFILYIWRWRMHQERLLWAEIQCQFQFFRGSLSWMWGKMRWGCYKMGPMRSNCKLGLIGALRGLWMFLNTLTSIRFSTMRLFLSSKRQVSWLWVSLIAHKLKAAARFLKASYVRYSLRIWAPECNRGSRSRNLELGLSTGCHQIDCSLVSLYGSQWVVRNSRVSWARPRMSL